jgi:glyoxylase-like metal-dependent hydrolase (beta-lactamase superfamily II)
LAVRGIPEQVTALPALHLRPEAAPGGFTVNQFLVDSDEVLHLGGAALARRVTEIATPHVPHNWESHMFFEQETGTLFCGDLLTQLGDGPPVTGEDILDAAIAAEETFHQTSLAPAATTTRPGRFPGRARVERRTTSSAKSQPGPSAPRPGTLFV